MPDQGSQATWGTASAAVSATMAAAVTGPNASAMRTMRWGRPRCCAGSPAPAVDPVFTSARTSSSSAAWGAVIVTAALIVLRSHVFLQYEQADFDADQAIVGLMAHHLSEGRAWPLFFYGQLYMMGVQAWMAAPVFLVLGPTVFALKLPLLALNIVTGALLVRLLVRDAGLRAWQAALAGAWFALLPPVTASRMVQAQGGTVEPLLYALLLWMLRRRAVAFGLVFAFGFLQREFTVFAVFAILAVEFWTGEVWSRRRAAHWRVVLLVFLGARESVTLLRHTASMFGPDAPPPRLEEGVTNVDLVARSVCLAPGHVLGNVGWLVAHNVPTFFGARTQPARVLILSNGATGSAWAGVPALVAWGAAGVVIVRRGWRWLSPLRAPDDGRVVLPVVLLLTGVLGLAGVATGCDVRSIITIRYHLLLALAPAGLTALAFVVGALADRSPDSVSRGTSGGAAVRVMCVAVVMWGVAMVVQHVRLIHEYRTTPPVNAYRVLADDLVAHGDRYGWASYWVSYHVDFLSGERLHLSPTSAVRIHEYARLALRAGPDAVIIGNEPCGPGSIARRVEAWWVCREGRPGVTSP